MGASSTPKLVSGCLQEVNMAVGSLKVQVNPFMEEKYSPRYNLKKEHIEEMS